MKFSVAFDEQVRAVAYSPRACALAGSINAGLLLCELIYWTGKEQDGSGWIYKTAEELTEETGLSYEEQKRARRKLRQRGLVQERYRRGEHQLYFRGNLDAVKRPDAELRPDGSDAAHQGNSTMLIGEKPPCSSGDSPDAHQGIPTMLIKGLPCSLNGTSESTSENTTEKQAGVSKLEEPLGWSLAHGLPVSAEQLEREKLGDEATAEFESALGVRAWPWGSTRAWEKMVALLSEAWRQDRGIFKKYA